MSDVDSIKHLSNGCGISICLVKKVTNCKIHLRDVLKVSMSNCRQ